MKRTQKQLARISLGEEIRALVTKVITTVGASGPKDKGKVMGPLMPQVKGKADGRLVNEIVTELLTE